jgi:methionyl-tRNA formyltransferase
VLQTVQMIEVGTMHPKPQDNALATPAPKIFKQDCRVPWPASAKKINDFIRGLSPYPTAWTIHKGKTLKLFKTSIVETTESQPGVILQRTNDALVVGTGEHALAVLEIQQEGRKKMAVAEFLRGYPIEAGDVLE